jgi:hypothetical protein
MSWLNFHPYLDFHEDTAVGFVSCAPDSLLIGGLTIAGIFTSGKPWKTDRSIRVVVCGHGSKIAREPDNLQPSKKDLRDRENPANFQKAPISFAVVLQASAY